MKASASIAPQAGNAIARSPGERAFDLCFYPFGAMLALVVMGLFGNLFIGLAGARKPHTEAELAATVPDPAWHAWLPFTIGVMLAIYWLWASWSLAVAWRDPRARVLRFSAVFLLLFDASIALALLSSPFSGSN